MRHCCTGACTSHKLAPPSSARHTCRRQTAVDLTSVWCCDISPQFAFCRRFWVLSVERSDIRSWSYPPLPVLFRHLRGAVGYLAESPPSYTITYLRDTVRHPSTSTTPLVQPSLKFKLSIPPFCSFLCFLISSQSLDPTTKSTTRPLP